MITCDTSIRRLPVATLIEQSPKVKTKKKTCFAAPPQETPIQLPVDVPQRIAEKAYALYEQRGKREGYALQDWLDAEHIVNEELYEVH